MLFRKCGCLVAYGKYIFRKCFSVLTCLWCKMISVFILPSNTIFWKIERERERGRRESPLPATHELRLRRQPRDFAPRTQIAVQLRLRIAPRSHPLTSPVNPEARIARLRLCTLRLRQDGTETAPIALSSQLRNGWVFMNLTWFDDFFFSWVLMNLIGFDEFDQICVYLLKNCIIYLFGS